MRWSVDFVVFYRIVFRFVFHDLYHISEEKNLGTVCINFHKYLGSWQFVFFALCTTFSAIYFTILLPALPSSFPVPYLIIDFSANQILCLSKQHHLLLPNFFTYRHLYFFPTIPLSSFAAIFFTLLFLLISPPPPVPPTSPSTSP